MISTLKAIAHRWSAGLLLLTLLTGLTAADKAEDHKSSGSPLPGQLQLKLKTLPTYHYPYHDLPAQLTAEKQTFLRLFSFGSLMNYDSARRTLSDKALSSRSPAIAYGVKTLFNRDVPLARYRHWKKPENPDARGVLNSLVVNDSYSTVAGVVIEIPVDEIGALLNREEGYDLEPVIIQYWQQASSNEDSGYDIAYILSARTPGPYTSSTIVPHPDYYQLVRDSARSYGSLFFQHWLRTTHLADGITPILKYEMAGKERAEPVVL